MPYVHGDPATDDPPLSCERTMAEASIPGHFRENYTLQISDAKCIEHFPDHLPTPVAGASRRWQLGVKRNSRAASQPNDGPTAFLVHHVRREQEHSALRDFFPKFPTSPSFLLISRSALTLSSLY